MKHKIHSENDHDDMAFLLQEDGYFHVHSLFSKDFVNEILLRIKFRLRECAKDLSCSYGEYMRSVSRWADPSPVTKGFDKVVIRPLKLYLEPIIGECELAKLNVISKTPFSPAPIPLHQDISYSPSSPYQLSVWIALTDVPIESGAIKVIAGSHTAPIESAVDFWDPDFKDLKHVKAKAERNISVKAGDAIFFDSRLWHGSTQNESSLERFALVTRWTGENYVASPIPAIQPTPFGMWTCQKKTEEILKTGFNVLMKNKAKNYKDLLEQWGHSLENNKFSFLEDIKKAKQDLKHVYLLHLAHEKHNGGDAQGVLYAQLWKSLLNPLSHYLNEQHGE